jgi:hypothetical protein
VAGFLKRPAPGLHSPHAEAQAPEARPSRRPVPTIIEHLTAERASRSYGPQWIMLHSVARHLGISDAEAQEAVALELERHRIITDGGAPPHGVSLIWGGGEG